MFLSRNKKNNKYHFKPQFYYKKVGFKGVKIIKVCFRDVIWILWPQKPYFDIQKIKWLLPMQQYNICLFVYKASSVAGY